MTGNTSQKILELKSICEHRIFNFFKITEEEYNSDPIIIDSRLWNQKAVLGHLLDLAVFQHQRMIRVQCEEAPKIDHNIEVWLKCGHYDKINSRKILIFWKNYNSFIIDLLQCMSPQELSKTCTTNGTDFLTVEALFLEYVDDVKKHTDDMINAFILSVST